MKETRRGAFLASQPAAGKQPAGLPETCCAHFYCVPALSACISTMFKPFLCAVLLILSTFLCAHFYCIPAPPHAEPCWNHLFQHFYSMLESSIFCLLSSSVSALLFFITHCYCTLAPHGCFAIVFQQLRSSTTLFCVYFHCVY